MKKRVKLILEWDAGVYDDSDGWEIPTNWEDYEETFYQADIFLHDFEITGVILEDVDEKGS